MEELLELRSAVEAGRYNDALLIIQEMEDIVRDDKITKIGSYMVILLIHLIKSHAEGRMTRSWRNSILNALSSIEKANKRRSSGGTYMTASELQATLEENFADALRRASEEAFGGVYTAKQLAERVQIAAIKEQAMDYILNGMPESED